MLAALLTTLTTLLAALSGLPSVNPDAKDLRLGHALRRHKRRLAGGMMFDKADDDARKNTGRWVVTVSGDAEMRT